MSDQTAQPNGAQPAETPAEPAATQQQVAEPASQPEQSLEQRAAAIRLDQPSAPEDTFTQNINRDYQKELESITDPTAREMAQKILDKKINDIESGWKNMRDKHSQDVQQFKRQQQEYNPNQPWTPERIQNELMKNPEFLQAAQTLQSSQAPSGWEGTAEDWSSLSDADKQRFVNLESKQNAVEAKMNQWMQQQQFNTEHQACSQKYPDYQPEVVDGIRQKLLNGEIEATGEYLWKAHNYESHGKKMYELGKQDERSAIGQAQQAASPLGTGMQVTEGTPPSERKENENPTEYFKRIARENLAKLKQ